LNSGSPKLSVTSLHAASSLPSPTWRESFADISTPTRQMPDRFGGSIPTLPAASAVTNSLRQATSSTPPIVGYAGATTAQRERATCKYSYNGGPYSEAASILHPRRVPAILVRRGIWQLCLQSRPEHHTVHKRRSDVAFQLIWRCLRFPHFCLNILFDNAPQVQCWSPTWPQLLRRS
jgi:hypothetical protein